MRDARPRSIRLRRRAAAVSLATATLAALVALPSRAATPPSLASARAHLASLNARLALLAQQEHDARVGLRASEQALTRAQAQAVAAQADAARAQAAAAAVARTAYEGAVPELDALLGSTSLAAMGDRVQFLGIMAQKDATTVALARVSEQRARAAARAVQSLIGKRQRLLVSLSAARTDLARAVASQIATIHRIERSLRRPVIPPPTAPGGAAGGGAAGGGAPAPPTPGSGPTPSPSPPPPPPPAPTIDALIYSLWGHGRQGHIAECIANRESGDNPNARSAAGAAGLFQLMPFWWDGANAYGWKFDPYDPYQNAYHAHLIWQRSGWGPWGGGC